MLTGTGAALVIGTMLIAEAMPLRRLMRRRGLVLAPRARRRGVRMGPLAGGTVGAGIILLSLLMAAGLEGAAVGRDRRRRLDRHQVDQALTFGLAGAVTAKVIAVALLSAASPPRRLLREGDDQPSSRASTPSSSTRWWPAGAR